MIYKLVMDQIPPSINHYYGYRAFGKAVSKYVSKKGKEFKALLNQMALATRQGPLEGDLRMTMHLQFPTRRRCDIDNYCKSVLDALNGVYYEDDSQITELNITKSYKKNEPQTRIFLEAI